MNDDHWKNEYRKLRELNPNLYHKALQYGEGVSITHSLSIKAAADVERAIVGIVLVALGAGG